MLYTGKAPPVTRVCVKDRKTARIIARHREKHALPALPSERIYTSISRSPRPGKGSLAVLHDTKTKNMEAFFLFFRNLFFFFSRFQGISFSPGVYPSLSSWAIPALLPCPLSPSPSPAPILPLHPRPPQALLLPGSSPRHDATWRPRPIISRFLDLHIDTHLFAWTADFSQLACCKYAGL